MKIEKLDDIGSHRVRFVKLQIIIIGYPLCAHIENLIQQGHS